MENKYYKAVSFKDERPKDKTKSYSAFYPNEMYGFLKWDDQDAMFLFNFDPISVNTHLIWLKPITIEEILEENK